MIDVKVQMEVEDVMDAILDNRYSTVAYEDYERQIFTQIRNKALTDGTFKADMENWVGNAFSSTPDIDDIRELVLDAVYDRLCTIYVQAVRETLDKGKVIELARRFSGKSEND